MSFPKLYHVRLLGYEAINSLRDEDIVVLDPGEYQAWKTRLCEPGQGFTPFHFEMWPLLVLREVR